MKGKDVNGNSHILNMTSRAKDKKKGKGARRGQEADAERKQGKCYFIEFYNK